MDCVVCDDPLREAADLLLLRGHEYRTIARKLERPPAWAVALKQHLFEKHVRGPNRENYTILIVDYLQEANRMLAREIERPRDEQRVSIINLCHRAIQWSIKGYCQMEGLYGIADKKKLSGDVIEALNELAQGNPEAVKRIADARRKEKPILIEAKPVTGVSDEPEGDSNA